MRKFDCLRGALFLLVTAGCTGVIDASPSGQPGPMAAGVPGHVGGHAGEAPPPGAGTGSGGASAPAAFTPSRSLVRRLTRAEYIKSVFELTGVPIAADDLLDDPTVNGFDNNMDVLGISPLLLGQYMTEAASAAEKVASDPTLLGRIFACPSGPRATCLRTAIKSFARRAFRRNPDDKEVDAVVAVATPDAGDATPNMDVRLALQAMLQSPHFLLRFELGSPDAARAGWRRVTPWEQATRLAFFLTGGPPSPAVLTAAEEGKLAASAQIATMARTLLAQPAARESLRRFVSQWLRLYRVDLLKPDVTRYPMWNDAVRSSAGEETVRFVEDHIWRDGASFLGVLDDRYTFVGPELARLYKLPAVPSGWTRVSTEELAEPRSGLMTQASVLALTGRSELLAPILRGQYVRDVLLCNPPPPPPPDVQSPPDDGSTTPKSIREVLAHHREEARCRVCHDLMDPIGFGLENYDLVGAYRSVDTANRPLTGEGRVVGVDQPDFVGGVELGQRLATSPQFSMCVVTNMFRYATGRTERSSDAPALEALDAGFRSSRYDLRELVVKLTESDAFNFITAQESAP